MGKDMQDEIRQQDRMVGQLEQAWWRTKTWNTRVLPSHYKRVLPSTSLSGILRLK